MFIKRLFYKPFSGCKGTNFSRNYLIYKNTISLRNKNFNVLQVILTTIYINFYITSLQTLTSSII